MSAIIPEKFRITRSFLFEVIVFINPFRITRSFLFEVIVFINPFRLRRSQILVARIPPPRSQRTVGAQHILDLNLRKIISHLRSEMLSNLIVLPIYRTYGATCSQTSSFYQCIAPTERNAPEFYQYIAPMARNVPKPHRSTNISHLWREMFPNLIVIPIFRSYGAHGRSFTFYF